MLVEKIECRNHLIRNYMQKLSVISKKTSFPILLRKFVQTNIIKFRTTVVRSISHRKNELTSTTQKTESTTAKCIIYLNILYVCTFIQCIFKF